MDRRKKNKDKVEDKDMSPREAGLQTDFGKSQSLKEALLSI